MTFKSNKTALAVCAIALLAAPCDAAAEPWIAIRTGLKCATCHVNRSGGGGRNDFGAVWAQTELPIKPLTPVRSRRLNDWASIGFNLRAVGSAAISKPDSAPDTPTTQMEITEAQVQLEARFVQNVLALYIDQTVGPSQAFTREAFGLAEWRGKVPGYAKVGKFLLPYGWRLWDEEALIRTQTGFLYSTPDIGFEVGIEPGPLSWFLSVTNGSTGAAEGNSGKKLSSMATLTWRHFRVGASGSYNKASASDTQTYGALAGVNIGIVSLLGEADVIFDSFSDAQTQDRDQFVGYIEGNVWARKGVNIKISHGFHQPTASIRNEAVNTPEDQRTRTRAGVEVFPVSFVQLSGYYTRFDNAGDARDLDRISIEAHMHF